MKTKYGLWPFVRIKEILEEKGWTQKELAEMMGETPQQVNKWVMGVEPCLSALGRMAMTLDVKLEDLVWYAGEDADFGINSRVYIRGDIVKQMQHLKSETELLDALKHYYRWTNEELIGVKIASKDLKKGEIVLACTSKDNSGDFIEWAKKARDDMYRL